MRNVALLILELAGCDRPVELPVPAPAPVPMTGTLSGTVKLLGKLPPPGLPPEPPRTPKGDPVDVSKAKRFILGEGQTMANVYVAVKSGLGDRKFATPREPVILNQVGLLYLPLVLGVMTDQKLAVRNSDDCMHNVHISPRINPKFNRGQPTRGVEDTFTFSKPELAIPIKCDVHPWMRAWLHVSDHPFFAITAVDGKYSLTGLPPGEYEILAWHEGFLKLPLVSKVNVEAGKTATLDFTFELPGK